MSANRLSTVSRRYSDCRFYTACRTLDVDGIKSAWMQNARRQLEGIRMMFDVLLDSLTGAEECYDVAMHYLANGPRESLTRRVSNLVAVLRNMVADSRFFSVEHICFVEAFHASTEVYSIRVPKQVTIRSAMFALLSARQRRVGSVAAVRRLPVEMSRMVAEFLWSAADDAVADDDDDDDDDDL